MNGFAIVAIPLAAAVLCAALILLLRPLLTRYALARPNARSSHTAPTPQGGGVAVIAATIAAAFLPFSPLMLDSGLWVLFGATVFIAFVGAVDDLRSIPVLPRLLLQAIAVGAVLGAMPATFHLFPFIPLWIERALLLIAGLWFINLVNFMDGLDGMTVAEIVPIAAALAFLGVTGNLSGNATLIALALGGAMIGFAPFNRPVAKLFLGDVGSLPIGLLSGWCLLQLAGSGHLAAALLLPLYYLADATITLMRRITNREDVRIAHRSHFYQRATSNGFSVMRVVTEVFLLNIVLAVLAILTIFSQSIAFDAAALIAGCLDVAFVLRRFSAKQPQPA